MHLLTEKEQVKCAMQMTWSEIRDHNDALTKLHRKLEEYEKIQDIIYKREAKDEKVKL